MQLLKALRLLLIIGLIITLLVMCQGKQKQSEAIIKVFSGTEYERLIQYIIAQAKHETNNYNSKLSKEANNLFGVKQFNKPTPFKSKHGYYRVFNTYEDSARWLLDYFRRKKFPTRVVDACDYATVLKSLRYYEDSVDNYCNGLKRWL